MVMVVMNTMKGKMKLVIGMMVDMVMKYEYGIDDYYDGL